MNLNLETADREVFNALDWVEEMGGFYKGLKLLSTASLLVFASKNFEKYMISHLYGSQENGQNRGRNSEGKTRMTSLQ